MVLDADGSVLGSVAALDARGALDGMSDEHGGNGAARQ
jgi:hypothetical protein